MCCQKPYFQLIPGHPTCSDGRVVYGAATDCTLSLTTAGVRIPVCACEKVASDLELGSGFSPGSPVSSINFNWLATIGINVTKNHRTLTNVLYTNV